MYESRIYLMEKSDITIDGKIVDTIYNEIACFNLASCGWEFRNLFKTEFACCLYNLVSDEDEIISEDKYGDKLRYAKASDVLDWLKGSENQQHYRRFAPLIAYLEALQPGEWKSLIIVHYGY